MRAVVLKEYGSLDNLDLMEFPDPIPGPEEIIVDVRATAVNYVDLVLIGGTYQFRPEIPFVPGKGPAGVVKAVGENVHDFAPGDRVLAMAEQGGYAEFAPIHRNNCYRLPDGLSFSDAASMALVYDTAWFSLVERGRFEAGEAVLVLGASGGVGLAAIQLVNALSGTALAGIANPGKADLVRDAGAAHRRSCRRRSEEQSTRTSVCGDGRTWRRRGDRSAGRRFVRCCYPRRRLARAHGGDRLRGRPYPDPESQLLLVKNIDVGGLQISDYRRRRPDLTANVSHRFSSSTS